MARARNRRPGHLVPLGRPDAPRRPAVTDGRHQLGVGCPTTGRDQQVEPTHPGASERLEQALGTNAAGTEDEDRGPTRPPELGAGADGQQRRRPAAQPDGGGDERSGGDGTGQQHHPSPSKALTEEGETQGGDQHREMGPVQLTERQRRAHPRHRGHPADQHRGGNVDQRRELPADDSGGDPSAEPPGHHQPGGRSGQEVGR